MRLTTDPVAGYPFRREISSGAVVVNDKNDVLILHEVREDRWCLPKGHVEKDENEIDAAIRETQEETGIVIDKIKGKVGRVFYSFFDSEKKTNINKEVVYYLAHGTGTLSPEPIFDSVMWLPFADAIKIVKTDTEREILRKAFEMGKNG